MDAIRSVVRGSGSVGVRSICYIYLVILRGLSVCLSLSVISLLDVYGWLLCVSLLNH